MREQRSMGRNRRWRLGLAAGCAAALCLASLPGASADGEDDETYPSRERIRQAEERAATTADQVDQIEAALLAADERLQQLSIDAAKAAEAYNGARYELQQSRIGARRAQRTADRAAVDIRQLEDKLADAVVSNFESGGTLTNVQILVEDPDPNALLEHLDAYAGVTGAMSSDLDSYESAKVVADVLEDRAKDAVQEQEDATEAAEAAKETAETAVAEAQNAVSSIAAEKAALVRQLARAKDISIELARDRQQALAQQAAEEAAAEAAEQAEQQQEQEQQEPNEPEQQDPPDNNDPPPDNDPPNDPPPDNDPPNDPPPDTNDPGPSHGARAAIAYAKAQLGEPYVYGAAGPDTWDCSGLTMQAWAAAGEYLSHWSVAQYYETTPISFSGIRRGDLLFWGDGSDPDSIYHVAIYLGNGLMIHAPRPGRSVEIVSLYYWILPNFYGRV